MKTKLPFFIAGIFFISTGFITPVSPVLKNSEAISNGQTFFNNFESFRTHRQGRAGVTATWSFATSSNVIGFELIKTYEDPTDPYANWETICAIPCTAVRSYKFTDNGVFPGFISYKVIAFLTDGTEVESAVSTLQIVSH
jgi:hypothetical protein